MLGIGELCKWLWRNFILWVKLWFIGGPCEFAAVPRGDIDNGEWVVELLFLMSGFVDPLVAFT